MTTIGQDWSKYIVSSEIVNDDRGMGAETEHSIQCDGFKCPSVVNFLMYLVLYGSIQ